MYRCLEIKLETYEISTVEGVALCTCRAFGVEALVEVVGTHSEEVLTGNVYAASFDVSLTSPLGGKGVAESYVLETAESTALDPVRREEVVLRAAAYVVDEDRVLGIGVLGSP